MFGIIGVIASTAAASAAAGNAIKNPESVPVESKMKEKEGFDWLTIFVVLESLLFASPFAALFYIAFKLTFAIKGMPW